MALVVKDRVQEVTTTTGTGTVTLAGAVSGFQDFSAIGDGNTCYYAITSGTDWEVGIGTYTSSGTTLSRDTILESSNSGSAITLSGTSNVFVTYPAEKSVDIETAQTLTNKTISGANNTLSNIGNSSLTNSSITINGTATSLGDSISVGVVWQSVQTSSFTAVAGQAYPVNTTSGAITVTLPASPSAGQLITITDYAGTFNTNNCTLNPNGNKIQSSISNQILSTNSQSVGLVYIDSTQGWLVYDGFLTSPIKREYQVDYLVVAGGGGGGGNLSGGSSGGGGGAGGYRASNLLLQPGTSYTITVGSGGSAGNTGVNGGNGSNSVFSTITSTGGGGGGGITGGAALSGGSGGGGNIFSVGGGSGTTGQGNDGGSAASNNLDAGGGGGAGAVGGNASSGVGGNGGNGSASSITGSSVTRAGGGGGGSYLGTKGTGGTGGGGNGAVSGTPATAGAANTGGGGGGGARTSGGSGVASAAGGSGVVILSIPTGYYSGVTTGSPTVTTSGGNTILTYNSSGTYTA
jgi:hypothetical protein